MNLGLYCPNAPQTLLSLGHLHSCGGSFSTTSDPPTVRIFADPTTLLDVVQLTPHSNLYSTTTSQLYSALQTHPHLNSLPATHPPSRMFPPTLLQFAITHPPQQPQPIFTPTTSPQHPPHLRLTATTPHEQAYLGATPHISATQYARLLLALDLHCAQAHPPDTKLCKELSTGKHPYSTLTSADILLMRKVFGPCPQCLEGRAYKPASIRVTSTTPPTTHPGQTISFDPQKLPCPVLGGYTHKVILVDEHTGHISQPGIRSKSNAAMFQGMHLSLQRTYNAHGHKISTLHGDAERVNTSLAPHFGSIGAKLQVSLPGHHAHRAERSTQTVQARARSVVASLPYHLPPELTLLLHQSVGETLNNSICKASSPLTPNEALSGFKPQRPPIPFGRSALVLQPTDKRTTLARTTGTPLTLIPVTELGVSMGLQAGTDRTQWLLSNGVVVPRTPIGQLLPPTFVPFNWKPKPVIAMQPTLPVDSKVQSHQPDTSFNTSLQFPDLTPTDAALHLRHLAENTDTHQHLEDHLLPSYPAPREHPRPGSSTAPLVSPPFPPPPSQPLFPVPSVTLPPSSPVTAMPPQTTASVVIDSLNIIAPNAIPHPVSSAELPSSPPPSPPPPILHIPPAHPSIPPPAPTSSTTSFTSATRSSTRGRALPPGFWGSALLSTTATGHQIRKQENIQLAAKRDRLNRLQNPPADSLNNRATDLRPIPPTRQQNEFPLKKALLVLDNMKVHAAVDKEVDKIFTKYASLRRITPSAVEPTAVFVRSKLILREKTNKDVTARLALDGGQQPPHTYGDTHAGTSDAPHRNFVLATSQADAAHRGVKLITFDFDVPAAFLNKNALTREHTNQIQICTRLPHDMPPPNNGTLCEVIGAHYGFLKQSNHIYDQDFIHLMTSNGYISAPSHPYTFTKFSPTSPLDKIVVSMHVDDGDGNTTLPELYEEFQNIIIGRYGPLDFHSPSRGTCSQIQVVNPDNSITLHYGPYILKMLSRIGMDLVPPALSPDVKGLFDPSQDTTPLTPSAAAEFRTINGELIHVLPLRHDIRKVVTHLLTLSDNPDQGAYLKQLHLLRYLKSSPNAGPTFSADPKNYPNEVEIHSASDCAHNY